MRLPSLEVASSTLAKRTGQTSNQYERCCVHVWLCLWRFEIYTSPRKMDL